MAQQLKIDIVARDKSKQALNSLKGRLGKLKASVFNLRNAFIGLGAGLVIRSIITTGKEIEGLQVRLKFLFGTAQEGAKAFDEMAKFASKVPFSLAEIQQGAGVLAVVSKDAEQMAKMMRITGNVAAVTGLDFKTTAEQIQRSMSAGISAADLFRDRGVKAMLGFKAGATVSIEETVAAFDRVFGEGGKFDGATDELAKTFEGTLSMIGDKIFNFKRVLLEAGFFNELKKQFGNLNQSLEDNAKKLDIIATKIGKGLAIALKGLANIVITIKDNFDKLALALGALIALKVATFFYGITTALVGLTIGMNAFNAATKKNIIFGSVMVFASAMGFLIHKFKEFKGELNKQEESIESLNAKIIKWQKILDESNLKEHSKLKKKLTLNIQVAEEKIRLLKIERDELKMIETAHVRVKNAVKEVNKSFQEHWVLNQIEASQNAMHEFMNKTKEAGKTFKEAFAENELNRSHDAMQKMMNETIGQSKTFREIWREINEKELQKFLDGFNNIKTIIAEGLNQGIKSFSDALARSVIYGKKLSETFRRMAQDIAIRLLSTLIQWGIQLAVAWLYTKYIKKDEKDITREKQKQLALQAAIFALSGGSSFFGFGGKQHGGAVSKGKPILVGERGPELFVPNSSGQIQQNARGTDTGTTNINFSINATDVTGVRKLLIDNRATIVNVINSALNEKGREALV